MIKWILFWAINFFRTFNLTVINDGKTKEKFYLKNHFFVPDVKGIDVLMKGKSIIAFLKL